MLGNGEMVARLVLAGLMGSVIGFERERLQWAAGLRTHMLVCVGACLAMLVSAFGFSDMLGHKDVVLDPSRVAAQVVSGIGFLGAGTILLRGEVVKGLTTAASLWAVAAIGLAIGGGLYVAAIAATVIVVAILAGVKPIEESWRDRMQSRALHLTVKAGSLSIDTLQEVTGERASRVRQFVVRPGDNEGLEEVTIAFVRLPQASIDAVAERLKGNPAVIKVRTGSEM
ncbi:MgtC/SapB family protein [Methylorubrum zatmanii]|uniref:Protein MgtC n=1 Tax=Methylorubrum zatmanii TaxID=29429 RepID=A0ABW1WXA3_9HYPH|nr:MgtC/SapB family protein [Methylorubrum zatmanii]MBD8907386.1 methyltransferase [Methylorubrum zatmanii]